MPKNKTHSGSKKRFRLTGKQQVADFRIQADAHALCLHLPLQCAYHIRRVVADREYALASLGL